MTEQQKSTEDRLADLEKYVKDDLWVTNRSFIKRTFAIYGHYLLASIIIGTACAFVFGCFVLLIGIFSRVATS